MKVTNSKLRCKNQLGEKNAMYKHGMRNTRIYKTWSGMIDRCHNSRNKDYRNWGGRGIFVCDDWRHDFKKFYEDMGDRPLNTTLDRVDNSKGYFKGNCRWATHLEQQQNRRSNHLLTYKGETRPMSYWYLKFGINKATFEYRISKMGLPVDQAIETPIKQYKKAA